MSPAEIISHNPATLEELGRVPVTTSECVIDCVARARVAQAAWAARSFSERAQIVLRAREILLRDIDALALLIAQENGKPLVEALTAELYPSADLFYYFATNAERLLRAHALPTGVMRLLGRTSRLQYLPVGVVGVIAPWNYPFSIPAGAVAMNLLVGNAVLLKPSEYTPLVGQRLVEIFHEAGAPTDVLMHVPGDGRTGQALCESRVDKIIFTGSVRTGKQVMATAAVHLTPVILELGGKDAMIVRRDANLDHASSGAVWGAFTNAGQCCASVERVYVHEKIAREFIAQVVAKTKTLRQGVGTQTDVEIGAMNNAAQLAIVERHVADAKNRGAQILTGGARLATSPGYFFPPTVITGVDHTCAVMREETFGPLLPIMSVPDDATAVRLANDSPFGLTGSIWTRDRSAAKRLALQLRAGTVTINDCLYTYAICQTPWGGVGESGFGRTHSVLGLLELVRPLHVHVNYVPQWKDLWWFPYHRRLYDLFVAMSRALTGPWWQRLPLVPRLLAALRWRKL